jgi:hypothetical protein
METYESTDGDIGRDEASAALAAVRDSRARVAWSGYPTWYWLLTGACFGALPLVWLLSGWWSLAISALVAVLLVTVAHAASRVRGICEGWARGAMTHRDAIVLNGPPAALIIVGAIASKFASWSSIVAAALVFLLFAGTGLTLSARAARR